MDIRDIWGCNVTAGNWQRLLPRHYGHMTTFTYIVSAVQSQPLTFEQFANGESETSLDHLREMTKSRVGASLLMKNASNYLRYFMRPSAFSWSYALIY